MITDLLSILESLISFKSVTPKSAGCLEFTQRYLSELGFTCHVKYFGPPEQQVANLYAVYGKQEPNICFAGHLDVVPPGNEELWKSDPFKMTIKDNFVIGRGTVDMKGAIAAAILAAKNYIQDKSSFNGAISFLLTCDEEGDGIYGTKEMLEFIKDLTPRINFCILGEPTCTSQIGDTIKIGRRGSINFDLRVIGKQGHVAYPEKSLNPMPIMVSILNELCKLQLDQGTEFFLPSNLVITSLEGENPVRNLIPNSASAKFNIRFNNLHSPESLNQKIQDIISKYSNDHLLTYTCTSLPFIQEPSDQIRKFINLVQNETGILAKICTDGGTSDARYIHKYAEVVELGLCNNMAHKIDEFTEVSDLQTLYNVYYSSLVRFLG
ncbi:MAG: succinyl-diaminopimelate desuccinylase [Rickettsiales bacterium]|nr:succinyl-diaminopimelate desuccinylase [Rickettsiales bacterium]